MKLSLNWIFDHIAGKPLDIHAEAVVHTIIERLGSCTTEIDRVTRFDLDLTRLTLAQLEKIDRTEVGQELQLVSPELTQIFKISESSERKNIRLHGWYLLIRDVLSEQYRFATLQDLGSEKEGLVPEIFCRSRERMGGWKRHMEPVDYIITIDNKAITHRPDLWGHRGFAREIAALFDLKLVKESKLTAETLVQAVDKNFQATEGLPYTLSIDGVACKRLAVTALHDLPAHPCVPWIASRLARVDSRPVQLVVDLTNYIMFDIGQPMHAFNEAQFADGRLEARLAHAGEQLTLLDGKQIVLRNSDLVIANGSAPQALAGVMGGKASSVHIDTHNIIIESANFNPDYIRATSAHYALRTEASARFEKGLDPNQNVIALKRFLLLLKEVGVKYTMPQEIVSLGLQAEERIITVSQQFIVDRIGMEVSVKQVMDWLRALGFVVSKSGKTYTILVPSYRMQDVKIPEDIVEEVARGIGYNKIIPQLPRRTMDPIDHHAVMRIRMLKQESAYGLNCHEVDNYAIYDEQWLARMRYQPAHAVVIKNPVSENWRRLVTSLVLQLLKNLLLNSAYQQVNLFELNVVWHEANKQVIEEKKMAFVWFESRKSHEDEKLNYFYTGKAYLESLFHMLHMPVIWQKATAQELVQQPWYLPEQTAKLIHDGRLLGYAGIVSPATMSTVADGRAFVAELDAQMLIDYGAPVPSYQETSRYQSVELDMSMFVPVTMTVGTVEAAIVQADPRIISVVLHDFFEREGQRSITMRFTIVDQHKTLTKHDIDEVWERVKAQVTSRGVQVR